MKLIHSGSQKGKALLILSIHLLLGLGAFAQSDTKNKITLVENNLSGQVLIGEEQPMNLQERMQHYKIKGVSIAVIQNYKLAFAKAYGLADSASDTKLSTQSLFQAASISKSFNAVAILKLFRDKNLDLNADINTYLKDWKFPYDSLSKGKTINTKHLLSHTAGLSVHGFGGYEINQPLPTTIEILNGTSPANSAPVRSVFEPGIKQQYSGGGTTITQQMLTDITGESYEQYLNGKILKALGMTGSTFAQPPKYDKKQLLSTGYQMNGTPVKGNYHIYPEQAAAGLWTNPTDLSKYIIETQLSYQGKSSKILSQDDTRMRLSPYANDKGSALGVFIEDYNGVKYFGHGGSNSGFQSAYYGSLEGGNGLVIMVNSDNGAIIPEIINSIAKVYDFKGLYTTKTIALAKVQESILENYTGKYQLAPNFILTITKDGKQLFAQATGQGKSEIYAQSEAKFFSKAANATIEFIKDDKGKITELILNQGRIIHARKL